MNKPKEKRYCKGCLADVTDHMFCYCGEMYLTIGSTYSESEMNEIIGGSDSNKEVPHCKNHDKHTETERKIN